MEFLLNWYPLKMTEISAQLGKLSVKWVLSDDGLAVEKVDLSQDQCLVKIKDSKDKITEISCDIVLCCGSNYQY